MRMAGSRENSNKSLHGDLATGAVYQKKHVGIIMEVQNCICLSLSSKNGNPYGAVPS